MHLAKKGSHMKIVLVGASGDIGKAVARELGQRHTVIPAGRNSGEIVDIRSLDSVRALLSRVGPIDAIVSTAGKSHFGPLASMGPAEFAIGLNDKLMGQVNLVIAGQSALADGGSITLTSGILSERPIRSGSGTSMVNGAIEAFVRAAAVELPRGLKINAVSPSLLIESEERYRGSFPGFKPVAAADVALAYVRSIEGGQTGQIYQVF
ncbi:MAG: short chain dehydrogenase [Hyphomicrobiaceae bacterium]|nr:short chain dehydrogenase [Hyphomicrobiaceae bacterium]